MGQSSTVEIFHSSLVEVTVRGFTEVEIFLLRPGRDLDYLWIRLGKVRLDVRLEHAGREITQLVVMILVDLPAVELESCVPLFFAQAFADDTLEYAEGLQDVSDFDFAPQLLERLEENAVKSIFGRTATRDNFLEAESLQVDRHHTAAIPLYVLHLVRVDRGVLVVLRN